MKKLTVGRYNWFCERTCTRRWIAIWWGHVYTCTAVVCGCLRDNMFVDMACTLVPSRAGFVLDWSNRPPLIIIANWLIIIFFIKLIRRPTPCLVKKKLCADHGGQVPSRPYSAQYYCSWQKCSCISAAGRNQYMRWHWSFARQTLPGWHTMPLILICKLPNCKLCHLQIMPAANHVSCKLWQLQITPALGSVCFSGCHQKEAGHRSSQTFNYINGILLEF